MNRQVICFHLFNNFSGSPNVLATVINELSRKKYKVTLVTSFNNGGFLSDVICAEKINIPYLFKNNLFLRLFQFFKYQVLASVCLLRISRKAIVYINTIQPFLPAIVARVRGHKIIYHVHEAYPKKSTFTKFLFYVLQTTTNKIVCVSEYVKSQLNYKAVSKAHVVYNSLSTNFIKNQTSKLNSKGRKSIIMVSSAKEYKGIFEFCKLALLLEQYDFLLVCDATKQEISVLFSNYKNISNLQIFPTQTNIHPFYAKADLILNLSNPKQIIETFGLTIIEGMSYGLPAIVPPIGGITELVIDGFNGFHVDVNEKDIIIEKIHSVLQNENLYKTMSENSLLRSKEFDLDRQIDKIETIIDLLK